MSNKEELLNWHRLMGLTLEDFFQGTRYEVSPELDLSIKRQLLDVLLIRHRMGSNPEFIPDGLEKLTRYNLVSYKSLHEPINAWALDELVAHYVNLRKIKSGARRSPIKETYFQLIALCTRFPRNLNGHHELVRQQDGVYDMIWGSRPIRLIVLSQISKKPQNAIWNIFSGIPERVAFGARHLNWKKHSSSTLITKLFLRYSVEGIDMAYTLADFHRDTIEEFDAALSNEERFRIASKLSPKERLALIADLPSGERLALIADLPSKERLALIADLPSQERLALIADLPSQERLALIADLPPTERLETLANFSPSDLRDIPLEVKRRIALLINPADAG